MTGPSRNLAWSELACKDAGKTPYPAEWRDTRALDLARAFEAVREEYGHPLIVLSGYRTEAHNRKVGGARFSQHVQGRAVDIRPATGGIRYLRVLAKAALRVIETQPGVIGGFAEYPSFIHIDVRPGKLARWSGQRVDADRA